MGKFGQSLETAWLRVGNTAATPFRVWGEIANAWANVLRQGISGTKNMVEVGKQTLDALIDNFTNFSKVEGKWYQKLLKVPANLVSAVTRRPAMIAASGVASAANQWFLQPFKKLLYTPGKMFKWMRNATRLFSKKKGFDFAKYDTHETKEDTRASNRKAKSLGFFGAKKWVSEEKKVEEKKEKKVEEPKQEEKKSEKKEEQKKENEWKEIQKPNDTKNPVDTQKPTENKPEPKKEEPKKENKTTDKKDESEEKKSEKPAEKKENKTTDKKEENKKIENKKTENKEKKPENKTKEISAKIANPQSIVDLKNNEKEKAKEKDKAEEEKNFPEWNTLNYKKKAEYAKDFENILGENPTKESVEDRWKKNGKWENIKDILVTLRKDKNNAMAGYIEEFLSEKEALNEVA